MATEFERANPFTQVFTKHQKTRKKATLPT
ncbi:hypothetical protein COLO4_07225 [Corchorus olitorius]|uniref:Uncharacterized protein n=1 Tax=Corchorus olitorius TaxID=93759 RepID=A0A1R3KKG2_9ROSI|nr:hypothetical protein COLO4_07225 [Corchorus olitorius]